MARRRTRRRKQSYEQTGSQGSDSVQPNLIIEELSPRARRLVEGGVIDLTVIAGSGPGGRITSGDILHAARVMEVQQSVARIESVQPPAETVASSEATVIDPDLVVTEGDQENGEVASGQDPSPAAVDDGPTPGAEQSEAPAAPGLSDGDGIAPSESPQPEGAVAELGQDAAPAAGLDEPQADVGEPPVDPGSDTSTAVAVGGQPISTEPDPWQAYNGSSEGFSERARVGAEQSWGEAEAHLVAMAEEASTQDQPDEAAIAADLSQPLIDTVPPAPEAAAVESEDLEAVAPSPVSADSIQPAPSSAEGLVTGEPEVPDAVVEPEAQAPTATAPADEAEPEFQPVAATPLTEPEPAREVMMDFGTLELVDPESVWAEGAEDFAPWFLAHSRQLGDVLGLEAGLSDARQFTTKSATGVVGRDDSGEDVVVVSSQNAVADDSDLGRALGMAASSGAASVALVSAALHEDQLKALAWLNNQTKSGVKWYGIEMRVVRIADSPAAMLFDLVASPPQQ